MTFSRRLSAFGLLTLLITAVLFLAAVPASVSAQDTAEPAATAAAPTEEQGTFAKILSNIGDGLKAVGRTIAGWFRSIGQALGLTSSGRPEGASCEEVTDCGRGLVCLNTCFDEGGCDVYEKVCTPADAKGGSATVAVKPLYAACGAGDLCAEGTTCTRTCPAGADCETDRRCLAPTEPMGSCTEDDECSALCGELGFPPIGPSAFRAICTDGACHCQVREARPSLHITSCTDEALERVIVCPSGTRAACTREGCGTASCPVRLTCLTAPAFGGQCLLDSGCTNVACAEGTEPFCDLSDNKCRCRATESATVSCSDVSECQGISCPAGQNPACAGGVCTCEKKVLIEEEFVCTADSQCPANCPEEFMPACVDGSCACQRVQENVPVSCTTVEDCGGVSCPAEFEKICLDGTCACTRTTEQ